MYNLAGDNYAAVRSSHDTLLFPLTRCLRKAKGEMPRSALIVESLARW